MAKKKNSDAPEAQAPPNPNREAVAKAIETLGKNAEAGEMAKFIKDNFNIEMENKVIGIHRHHILKAKKKAAKTTAPKKAGKMSSSGGGDVGIAEIRAVKELVARHGADRVREIIDLLS